MIIDEFVRRQCVRLIIHDLYRFMFCGCCFYHYSKGDPDADTISIASEKVLYCNV